MKQEQAIKILQTGASVFLTGEPGSGKSYTVSSFVRYLHSHGIEPAVTASTGIAATHIGGITIHSWSGIGIARVLTKKDFKRIRDGQAGRRIRKAKVLILDEISMIDATTLDLVESVCTIVRDNDLPFGGLQVVLVGDFFQLPPISRGSVAAKFAFESKAWTRLDPAICYLDEQHRQEDETYLSVLSAIRSGEVEQAHLECLTDRIVTAEIDGKDITKLYSHNANVDNINNMELSTLITDERSFEMVTSGPEKLVAALVKSCISPAQLDLKVGATVMFTKNSPKDGFVNGTLGTVAGFDDENTRVLVKTRRGRVIEVGAMDWMVEENGKVKARISQIPLRLAWAITIHKSQGMSLDAAIVDLRSVFEYGQGYVALSRVRSLSGLYLLGYNERSLLVHPGILAQDNIFRQASCLQERKLQDLTTSETEDMNKRFIMWAEGDVQPRSSKQKKVKISTAEVTLGLLHDKMSIADVARERGLSETTINSHIEKLIVEGQLEVADVLPLLDADLVLALPTIQAAFEMCQTTSLTTVYTYFKGKYSYRELQIARMTNR